MVCEWRSGSPLNDLNLSVRKCDVYENRSKEGKKREDREKEHEVMRDVKAQEMVIKTSALRHIHLAGVQLQAQVSKWVRDRHYELQ